MAPHMCYLSPFLRATWLLYYSIPFLRCRIFHAGINFAISISLISSFNYCVFTASYITSSPLTPRYSIIFGPTILYNGHILFSHLNLYVLARNFHGTIMVLAKHKIRCTNDKMTIRDGNEAGVFKRWGLRLISIWWENFLIPSLSLGASQSLVLFRKTLFLVNLPTTITIIFNKTCFFNKNKIEIINKFTPSKQINF